MTEGREARKMSIAGQLAMEFLRRTRSSEERRMVSPVDFWDEAQAALTEARNRVERVFPD